jgi:hypothetical protein
MMDLQITPTVRDMMNKYATQISDRWMRIAPARYSTLENPELFFEELGQLVLVRVDELSNSLPEAGPARTTETYLQSVARLNSVRRQAEEIALSELEWPTPELSQDELRDEWEATSTPEQSLLEWASNLEGIPVDEELEALSIEWMLPIDFLYNLATSPNPWIFSAEHSETMISSRELRFQKYLQGI